MNPSPEHEPRSTIRMDARLDAATRHKVDNLARHFHRPRAAVLCQIMEWGLSHEQPGHLDQDESQDSVRHLSLYVASELHEHVQKAVATAGMKIAPWLRAMVRQITIADFPDIWQEATPRERSHDSLTYTERFMLRLNHTSSLKLQELVDRFYVPKAQIIRHLITQAEPEDFPLSWYMKAQERRAQQPRR